MYTYEDFIMPTEMCCRESKPEAIEFRSKLGFKQHDIILSKEQSLISKITKSFLNEKILLQHSVLDYRIDLYFSEHKLAKEAGEMDSLTEKKERIMKEKKK